MKSMLTEPVIETGNDTLAGYVKDPSEIANEIRDNTPIMVDDRDVQHSISIIPGGKYPRLALFPAVVLKDIPGAEELDGAILYGIVPGKHPELLPTGTHTSVSIDGFPVLGYRDELLDVYTGGPITIFPIQSLQGNEVIPMPLPMPPGDTSLEAAAAVANSGEWGGVMPFAVTGRVDNSGVIVPNNWTEYKRRFMDSYNVCVAGSDKTADFKVNSLAQLVGYLKLCKNPCLQYYRGIPGHRGKSFAADDKLDQIMGMLMNMNTRLTAMEQGAGVPPMASNTNPQPHHNISSHQLPPGLPVGWFNQVEANYPGTIIHLDAFATRDPTGRKFNALLTNSTPSSQVGNTQEQNQALKVQRLRMSAQSMGIDMNLMTEEWIRNNGFRGPTTYQLQEFRAGRVPAPNVLAANTPGEVKQTAATVPISTNRVDTAKARTIAINALSAQFATQEAINATIEMMAQNGGKGLNQEQMTQLRNTYKPKGVAHMKAPNYMPPPPPQAGNSRAPTQEPVAREPEVEELTPLTRDQLRLLAVRKGYPTPPGEGRTVEDLQKLYVKHGVIKPEQIKGYIPPPVNPRAAGFRAPKGGQLD
jgi:hypothetical protein